MPRQIKTKFYLSYILIVVAASAINIGIIGFGVQVNQSALNIAYLLIFGVAVSILAALLFSFFFARSLFNPLANLKDAVENITKGNLSVRAEIFSRDEIGQLAASFNFMSDKLQELQLALQKKVTEKTSQLSSKEKELVEKNNDLEKNKKAILNILEDEQKLENTLKHEHKKLDTIIAKMGDGLILVDDKYKISLLNPIGEKLFDLQPGSAIGKDVREFFSIYQRGIELREAERPVMKTLTRMETVLVRLEDDIALKANSSGRSIPVALESTPLSRGILRGAVVVFRDVTEEKLLNDSKTSFISTASHQLRTPLTSMRWFAQMLLSGDAGAITDTEREFIEMIYQGTNRMVGMVNLLLQIARVEAGRVKIEPKPIDFKHLISDVVTSLKLELEAKSQNVEISSQPDPFPVIPADQDIVWQVLQNLISNASRYGLPKSPISVMMRQKEDVAEFAIGDQGIGIPKNRENKIFERFFRAENAIKLVPEGSGLGLALVKLLVEDWGGKVWFESQEGKSAIFYFTIPLAGMKAKEGEVKISI